MIAGQAGEAEADENDAGPGQQRAPVERVRQGLPEAEPKQHRRIEQGRVDEERHRDRDAPRRRGSPTPAPRSKAARGGSRRRCSGGCRTRSSRPGAKMSFRLSPAPPRRRRSRAAPEGRQVQPVAMGERQRHSDQRQERARDGVRKEPHRGRKGQHRRDQAIVGEVPAQMKGRHADQRDAAGAVDRVDAAARRPPAAPVALTSAASNSAASRTNSPSNSTGPVISTWSSSAPPFDDEFAARQAHRSLALREAETEAATTVAQAAEPQARVSPTPRSQTRAVTRHARRSRAKVMLAFSGNIGWTSIRAPHPAASTPGKVATKNTACGLPMLTAEAGPNAATGSPSGQSSSPASCPRPREQAECPPASRGGPMSTR